MRAMKRFVLLSMMILTPAIASAQAEKDTNVVLGRHQSSSVRSYDVCACDAFVHLHENGLGQLADPVQKRMG